MNITKTMNIAKVWRLLLVLMAVCPVIMLASCGNDEDEPGPADDDPEGYSTLIVGSWIDDYEKYGVNFSADHTGYDYLEYNSASNIEDLFTWSISRGVLAITWEGGWTDHYTIRLLNSTAMRLVDEDGDVMNFARGNGNNNSGGNTGGNTGGSTGGGDQGGSTSNVLAGTNWGGQPRYEDFYVRLEFKSNGTFTEIIREDGYEESDTYKYLVTGDVMVIEEGSVMANTLGSSVSFRISGSTITLSGAGSTWTLSRVI